MNSNLPSLEEWKIVVRLFYVEATEVYKYRIVKFKNSEYVDWARAYSPLPPGSKILDFEDVFSNEQAVILLMTWAVGQYFEDV